jgi:hypothetical protein
MTLIKLAPIGQVHLLFGHVLGNTKNIYSMMALPRSYLMASKKPIPFFA